MKELKVGDAVFVWRHSSPTGCSPAGAWTVVLVRTVDSSCRSWPPSTVELEEVPEWSPSLMRKRMRFRSFPNVLRIEGISTISSDDWLDNEDNLLDGCNSWPRSSNASELLIDLVVGRSPGWSNCPWTCPCSSSPWRGTSGAPTPPKSDRSRPHASRCSRWPSGCGRWRSSGAGSGWCASKLTSTSAVRSSFSDGAGRPRTKFPLLWRLAMMITKSKEAGCKNQRSLEHVTAPCRTGRVLNRVWIASCTCYSGWNGLLMACEVEFISPCWGLHVHNFIIIIILNHFADLGEPDWLNGAEGPDGIAEDCIIVLQSGVLTVTNLIARHTFVATTSTPPKVENAQCGPCILHGSEVYAGMAIGCARSSRSPAIPQARWPEVRCGPILERCSTHALALKVVLGTPGATVCSKRPSIRSFSTIPEISSGDSTNARRRACLAAEARLPEDAVAASPTPEEVRFSMAS